MAEIEPLFISGQDISDQAPKYKLFRVHVRLRSADRQCASSNMASFLLPSTSAQSPRIHCSTARMLASNVWKIGSFGRLDCRASRIIAN
mmetsp:Transcript_877/g.2002  ORF Transcript_877/g.2002 Transcript_877/m.2002 type:complete len:89 (-) Transcript_877:806-1072(-)